MFELSEDDTVSQFDVCEHLPLRGELAIDPISGKLLRTKRTGLLADPRGEFVSGLVGEPGESDVSCPILVTA